MALIKCPECQGQVSDKAAACPHCGYAGERAAGRSFAVDENHAKSSYRTQKKQLQKKRLGFVVVFFAAIMVMGFFAETNEDSSPRVAKSDSAQEGSLLSSVTNKSEQEVRPSKNEAENSGPEEWDGPYGESEAMMYCQTEARNRARNPSTVDFAWFTGAATRIDSDDNLITSIEFTAKNDFNAKLDYFATCKFTKQGDMTISITRI